MKCSILVLAGVLCCAVAYAVTQDTGGSPKDMAHESSVAQSLGVGVFPSLSPGVKIGETWYDQQHIGTMARMVDWGPSQGSGLIIHFVWMYLQAPVLEDRHMYYNAYFGWNGTQLRPGLGVSVQPGGDYAGYVGIDVSADNRAVVSGHNNQGSGYSPHLYYDAGPGSGNFSSSSRVPDSVMDYGAILGDEALWPKVCYHDVPGGTPVTHVIAQGDDWPADHPHPMYYFRKVGEGNVGTWDYPPYVIDTSFNYSQDITCSVADGKVALVWIANLPNAGDCDTCSSNTGLLHEDSDNDLYYQLSYDFGATFTPRVNLTNNTDGLAGFRPYTDVSALIASDNNLHIAWNGRYWPADANSGGDVSSTQCSMFYWGETLGFDGLGRGNLITVADLGWDQSVCNGGAWQLNGSKMSVSECNNRLYYLWVQFNDIPAGIEDDCAQRGLDGTDPYGSANGDLYLAVSETLDGLVWDQGRNITNTHSAGCDPTVGARCSSEHWPSMSRTGTDRTGDMSGATVIDPSGSYDGDYYLDVVYIDDPEPGSIIQDEGTWQLADVRWFRLACIEPYPATAPVVLGVFVDGSGPALNVTSHAPEISWAYTDPLDRHAQTQVEVAVGTDNDWAYAEMWNPAPFETADTFVVYAGTELLDGETYYLRLRVHNGLAWSNWYETTFRMNSLPSVPVPLQPLDDEQVSDMPTLWVENSSDAESDALAYDFFCTVDTTYGEPDPVEAFDIPEGTDSTAWQVSQPLHENWRYWWRARAYDGYEYSEWTDLFASAFFVNSTPEPPTMPDPAYPPDTGNMPVFNMLPTFLWSECTDPDPLDTVRYKLEVSIDPGFTFVQIVDSLPGASHTLSDSLTFNTHYWWRVTAFDNTGLSTLSTETPDFWTWTLGDLDHNHSQDIADLVFLIDYMFRDGPPPYPLFVADINGDCSNPIDIADLVYLVDYMFRGGPEPIPCP